MTEQYSGCCVLLPCSSGRTWVVPQRCLGEIVTIPTDDESPPDRISWRGEKLPVIDFGPGDELPWRDNRAGAGLVAVVVGQATKGCKYFGVAVRGPALGVSKLPEEEVEDVPEAAQDFSLAALRMNGTIYQVPDLLALQQAIGAGTLQIQ